MKRRYKQAAIGIGEVAYYLPSCTLSLDMLAKEKKLESKQNVMREFGFNKVRVASKETTYDIAERAVKKLIQNSQVLPTDIDVLLYSSALTDLSNYKKKPKDATELFQYPALKLQYNLGFTKARVVGISQAGCVSFLQSLQIAYDMIKAEPEVNRVLCVSSDILPKESRREILYNVISDGGCAAFVERNTKTNRIVAYSQVTKGFFWNSRENKNEIVASYFVTARHVINDALKKAGLTMKDIKLVIPHNVNMKSWEALLKILEIPKSKLFSRNIKRFGHTIAADNIINLSDATNSGLVKRGDYLLLFTFGFGAHWGCIILQH